MKESPPPEQKAALRKYHASLCLSILAGMAAAGSELFGESLRLSFVALVFGFIVGVASYLFFLCLMILLGFVLRGKFGPAVSNALCWILLLAAPALAWLLVVRIASRF